jgi:hypothetical protein
MSEQEREKNYWYISLGFLGLAAIALYRLYMEGFHPIFNARVWNTTTVLFLASLPLALVLETLLVFLTVKKAPLKFLVKQPSVNVQHEILRGNCSTAIEDRLKKLGFETKIESEDSNVTYLEFKKAKASSTYTFLEHSFFGMIEMIATRRGTEVTTKLTFDDTILIETGEMSDLQHLADYISLKCADLIIPKKVPLLITCGLALAYITVIYSLILDPAILRQRVLLVSFSNAAIVILIVALSITKTKQRELIGFRIGFLGLALAAVPYLAGFVVR